MTFGVLEAYETWNWIIIFWQGTHLYFSENSSQFFKFNQFIYFGQKGGSDGIASCLQCGRPGFDPWVGKIRWRRQWHPTPVLLPRKSHGQRSLVGYSPWHHKESDTMINLREWWCLNSINQHFKLINECQNSSLTVFKETLISCS